MTTRAVGQMTEMYENEVKRLNQRIAQLEAELAAAKVRGVGLVAERDALQDTITACEKEVAEVYDYATNGKFTKMNTAAGFVIDEIEAETRARSTEAAIAALRRLEKQCDVVFNGDLPHVTVETIREHIDAAMRGPQ